ncbi:unnamed protein product [Triticum turgidum subsp. durum]|uniref:Uncharacterized protein n=1 Tax=Triticum turgidum subsp. durum TaxID=4567 RepID=A0A9R0QFB2_TRITD|nr:unnamed protein product [Triticum turgidum subsp. durum]
MDLLQGRYITSVSRDMAPPTKAGFVESYASARLAFALVSGAFMFMMMSLRHGKISQSADSLKYVLAMICLHSVN